MKNREIICLSTHYWSDAWFRKQHFMSRFALENRVLFVEPSFSMVRKPHSSFQTNRLFSATLTQEMNNLWTLKPPRKLPKWTFPPITYLNYSRFAYFIRKACNELGFANPILWVYEYNYAPVIKSIPYSSLIFDLCDDYTAYVSSKKGNKKELVSGYVNSLIQSAELVITTTDTLKKKFINISKDSFVVSNGLDVNQFENALEKKRIPIELINLKKPIIGFIGVLFSFLDYSKLASTIAAMENYSFVFVGRIEDEVGVSKLVKFPNVYLLGQKPQSEIPNYINSFDVCLNPFLQDEVSRHVSPLKVFEYMVCGKPVVSTYMEALRETMGEKVNSLIYWVNPEALDYTKQIRLALSHDTQNLMDERKKFAKEYSWDSLTNKLKIKLNDLRFD